MPAAPLLVSDLATPALVVDVARLDANLDRMQALADAAGVRLRPHAKTHKSPDVARRQRDRGAAGLTVATVDEAEAFAAAGFDDLCLAGPVAGPGKAERLAQLAARGTRLTLTVDTERGADALAAAFAAAGQTARVLVEVDTGHGRCGVPWDGPEAVALGAHVASRAGLALAGVLTHGGHAYAGPGPDETSDAARARASAEERDCVLHAASRLGAAGLLDPLTAEVSVGSTPTATAFAPVLRDGFRVTEWRPGVYALGDAEQVALGSCQLTDCALAVLATVVSRHRDDDGTDRLVVDAGRKALASDRPATVEDFGVVLYSPRTRMANPHARLVALSEEHGWVRVPGGAVHDVGDPLWIVPNHACMAVAMHGTLHAAEGDEVVASWPVVARR